MFPITTITAGGKSADIITKLAMANTSPPVIQISRSCISARALRSQHITRTFPAIARTSSSFTPSVTTKTTDKIATEFKLAQSTAAALENLKPLMSHQACVAARNTQQAATTLYTAALNVTEIEVALNGVGREAYLRTIYYEGFHKGRYGQEHFDEALRRALEVEEET